MVLVYIPSFTAPSRICRGLESPPSLLFYSAALRLIMNFEVSGHEGYGLWVHLVTISKDKTSTYIKGFTKFGIKVL